MGDIANVKVGTFQGLRYIHTYLFKDRYPFARKIREVNIAKGHHQKPCTVSAPKVSIKATLCTTGIPFGQDLAEAQVEKRQRYLL